MNNSTKGRLLTIVVVVLLLANVATLTLFWLKKSDRKLPPPPQQQGGPFAFLVKELSFDSVQVAAYKTLRNEHQKDVEAYRTEIREGKDALFALLKDSGTNEGSVQNALNNIGEKEKKFDRVVFAHFQKVRALCTEAQKKKFDEVIQEALRMVPAGPQRQGPPPRREGDTGKEGPPPGMDGHQGPPPPDNADSNRPTPPQEGNHPSQ